MQFPGDPSLSCSASFSLYHCPASVLMLIGLVSICRHLIFGAKLSGQVYGIGQQKQHISLPRKQLLIILEINLGSLHLTVFLCKLLWG